jgi:ATP/maltotriose-dependent transcriptional regulator MalT
MYTPILTTKLYVPPVRPNWVPRPRLIKRLDQGLQLKLTLVSAPAGFGKTTLTMRSFGETRQTAGLPYHFLMRRRLCGFQNINAMN